MVTAQIKATSICSPAIHGLLGSATDRGKRRKSEASARMKKHFVEEKPDKLRVFTQIAAVTSQP